MAVWSKYIQLEVKYILRWTDKDVPVGALSQALFLCLDSRNRLSCALPVL